MYSTYDGAKKCAKDLKRLFDDSGFDFALNKCQMALTRAGGYRDWHDLQGALKNGERPVEPKAFRERLLAALPQPCRPPLCAWLDKELAVEDHDPEKPPRWWQDTHPYIFATAFLHRSRTRLLRPGSGKGQKLRERMVLDLLLSNYGLHDVPLLEPDTLAEVYSGKPDKMFRDDARHPRFEAEREVLSEAGILEIRRDCVRVLSSDAKAVTAHVIKMVEAD